MRKWREVVRLSVFVAWCGCAGDVGSDPMQVRDDDLPLEGDPTGEQSDASDAGAVDASPSPLDASATSDAQVLLDAATDAGSSSDGASASGDAGCATHGYEAFGKPFVDTYCVRCHGASSRTLGLDTLDKIQSNAARLELAVVTNQTMPKGSKLPTGDERARFGAFLACLPR